LIPPAQPEQQMAEHTDVAVIGAGPAGLAVGACLRRAGLDFIILERNRQVASSWRRHYQRLHLHTIKQLSALPYLPFPASYPRYVPRHLMIEYLDSYAARFDLKPRFGEAAGSVRRHGNEWHVESTSSSISAPHVVIASGFNAEPVTPSVPGMETFKGKVMHSADYADARPFAGQSVLVVGMGNTGAEIALDLAEAGARPSISLRDGVHIVPRDLFGIPIQIVAMLTTSVLPAKTIDALFPLILDLALGDLSTHGLRRPQQGILQQVADSARIPVLDVGTVGKICEGAIKVVPGLSEVTADGAVFAGGGSGTFDAIIFATGYRPGYRSFLDTDAIEIPGNALPDRANPDATIHFLGFRNPVTGLLRAISRDAVAIADSIVRERRRTAAR
jgi:cation diffusion facilitator CzcD-associated flavoprotein CzcO